ncbi:MAG: cupin domain-containing protein [Pseudomonadota bacterium]
MDVVNVLKLLADHPEGAFLEFSSFNDKHFGTCQVTGVSPGWEMHPDTDEFFFIIEGTVEITLLEDEQKHYIAPAGSSFVVPRGVWHKPGAPEGAKFIYFTPGQSLYSESDDPRLDA